MENKNILPSEEEIKKAIIKAYKESDCIANFINIYEAGINFILEFIQSQKFDFNETKEWSVGDTDELPEVICPHCWASQDTNTTGVCFQCKKEFIIESNTLYSTYKSGFNFEKNKLKFEVENLKADFEFQNIIMIFYNVGITPDGRAIMQEKYFKKQLQKYNWNAHLEQKILNSVEKQGSFVIFKGFIY